MQVHENHYVKCAGVAGLRERAAGLNGTNRTFSKSRQGPDGGKSRHLGGLKERKVRERGARGEVKSNAAETITGLRLRSA